MLQFELNDINLCAVYSPGPNFILKPATLLNNVQVKIKFLPHQNTMFPLKKPIN